MEDWGAQGQVAVDRSCQDPDLNWGHGDFQSPALPTELSRPVAYATFQS